MKARLVVNNMILELAAQTVTIRSVRRNNGQITWHINEPFLQGSLQVYWEGQTVRQNTAWPTRFPRWYLIQRFEDKKYAGLRKEICFRADDLPPHMPGSYISVPLCHDSERYTLNHHTLSAYLHFDMLPGDMSSHKNYFVVSHLCSHRDCLGGINGDLHISIEPQSINMQRISCWSKYLGCLEDSRRQQYICPGHTLPGDDVRRVYPSCIFYYGVVQPSKYDPPATTTTSANVGSQGEWEWVQENGQ